MLERFQSKILKGEAAKEQVFEWQSKGEKVVFTNGCFDLLHYGHIHYLAEARTLGDRLIIGLNSAASVSRLKGAHRPINDEKTRLFQLAVMEFVDAIVVFEEDTPYELIYFLQPDVLVKGGDWKPEQIVGAEVVLKKGGEVKSLDFVAGYSTSKIEQKIKDMD
ncbi:MAG: rfaE bifunctional protein nucleotidyltransferase chain/domain [Saprospiraceae bacterium]|jgi:rfaE bifunctional protein nucleotidyltransferase chain/domain